MQDYVSSGLLTGESLDFVLQHKTCMGFKIGFDYIETALTKIAQQYIDIFNDRYDGNRSTPQLFKTYRKYDFSGVKFKIEPLIKRSWQGDIGGTSELIED